MATKTKAQLEQEIEDSRNQIDSLKSELEKANRVETKDNAAQEPYELNESYIKAWELTKIIVNNGTAKRGLF